VCVCVNRMYHKDTIIYTVLVYIIACYFFLVGFALSQATKALRDSRVIAILYFRPLH